MKVAIIGQGYLGRQLAEDLSMYCTELIVTHHTRQRSPDSRPFNFFTDDIRQLLNGKKVDLVFLPAKVEFTDNPIELQKAMIRFVNGCQHSRLIYYSSDGINDGRRGMYTETDVPDPATRYGMNLAICESVIRCQAADYCIVRPSYIYGFSGYSDRGSTKPVLDGRLRRAIEEVQQWKVVERFTDMYKSPLHVRQVARVSERLALINYQGVVNVAGPRMSVYAFTKDALDTLGVSTDNLIEVLMPVNGSDKYLPDTSLDTSLMQSLTGITPLGVKESLLFFGKDLL